MSERISTEDSSVDRFFSTELNDDQLAQVDQAVARTFEKQDFSNLPAIEREKTPVEKEIRALCNDKINELRARYGLPPFEIPENNIHIIKRELWDAVGKSGKFSQQHQGVLMREQPSNTETAVVMGHEMLHFAAYAAMEYKERKLLDYRVGLIVNSRPDYKLHFNPLNEAVITELTKRLVLPLLGQPPFAEEHQQSVERLQYDPHATNKSEEEIFNEDTYYVGVIERENGTKARYAANFHYADARHGLEILCADLAAKTGEEKETIYQKFFRSTFDGNLLTIGKMIDRAYGSGTFRRIGQQQDEPEMLAVIKEITGTPETK